MMIEAAALWVFVILAHPTVVSAPYPTREACESALRREFEPEATTGCYLTTPADLRQLTVSTSYRLSKRSERRP